MYTVQGIRKSVPLIKGGTIMGFGGSCGGGCGFSGGFALLVVLFILLIIVGAACFC